ncbi:hypothetical protein B0I35DRAFT_498671 [Stachybotrys elegans]|uniref:Uncharacterized protein n=1 Tax=Stachybotrys elegans TaxID=80388 RepID=A0A8K0SG58_9HYPO|nr:hypothetical protein B0I35DRAFT_498671 [Stachybotrys elegans]
MWCQWLRRTWAVQELCLGNQWVKLQAKSRHKNQERNSRNLVEFLEQIIDKQAPPDFLNKSVSSLYNELHLEIALSSLRDEGSSKASAKSQSAFATRDGYLGTMHGLANVVDGEEALMIVVGAPNDRNYNSLRHDIEKAEKAAEKQSLLSSVDPRLWMNQKHQQGKLDVLDWKIDELTGKLEFCNGQAGQDQAGDWQRRRVEVSWDALAAVVALIGLRVILAGPATALLSIIANYCQRLFWHQGSTCERLEWSDIKEGPLRDAIPQRNNFDVDHYAIQSFKHCDKRCLDSTLGQVFQYSWIHASRREKRVFKPYQLSPAKKYVRTDAKTLKAFVMLGHGVRVKLTRVGGVLTAHLGVDSESQPQLHSRTKKEVDMILQGYPPFYLEKIVVTDTVHVPSPIQSRDDITRGGWIVGVGLDSSWTPPISTHNMNFGFSLPDGWKTPYDWRYRDGESWKQTCMAYAVRRFGEVVDKIQGLFPHDVRVQAASKIFDDLRTGTFHLAQKRPFACLRYYPDISDPEQRKWWLQGRYRSQLDAPQWQQAMAAFNHSGPLEPEEEDLFRDHMLPILQAAIKGMITYI